MGKNTSKNKKQNKEFVLLNFIDNHFFLYLIFSALIINIAIEFLGEHSFKEGFLY